MSYPILHAFESGIPVDLIADSLAEGDEWSVGDAQDAAAMLEVTPTRPVGSIARRLVAFWRGGAQ